VFSGPINHIDEVPDEAIVKDTVVEISAYSSGEHRESKVCYRMFAAACEKDSEDYNECQTREQYQHCSASCCYSESGAGVLDGNELKEAVYDGKGIAWCLAEPIEHGRFGPQIEDDSNHEGRPVNKMSPGGRKLVSIKKGPAEVWPSAIFFRQLCHGLRKKTGCRFNVSIFL